MLIIFITSVELRTYFRGHNVCKEIWNPKLGKLNVHIEPNNYVEKFATLAKFANTMLFPSKWQLLELYC